MPTIKQKKLARVLLENNGKPVSEAMLEVGYPPATAKNPQQVTESKGFIELMSKYLPDEKLTKKHDQLLNAVSLERINFDDNDSDEVIEEVVRQMEGYKLLHIVENTNTEGRVTSKYAYVKAPDNMAQDKALDKAYKLKGSYAPDKTLNVNLNVSTEAREKSKEAINQFLNQ